MINISDLVGKPFANGGRGPEFYDCWGLVREIYNRLGIELPMFQIDCFDSEAINSVYVSENRLIKLDKPEEYAIMAIKFNEPFVNHAGIYLGNKQFIHARRGSNVCIESIEHIYWKRNIAGYYKWRG